MPDFLTPDTWPAQTKITLLHVPFDAGYKNIVVWDNAQQQDNYFSNVQTRVIYYSEQFTYLRPMMPIKIPVPYSKAYAVNYCVVENPLQPVDEQGAFRKLYYFVLNVEYFNPQTSLLTLQLDVIQTYQNNVELGNMFIVSGHAGIANSNVKDPADPNFPKQLREYLTVPENMDIGAEYAIAYKKYIPFTDEDRSLGKIIIMSTIDLTIDAGTMSDPSIATAEGDICDGLPSAALAYVIDADQFVDFCRIIKDYPWISQGIISISCFPAKFLKDADLDHAGYLLNQRNGVLLLDKIKSINSSLIGKIEEVRHPNQEPINLFEIMRDHFGEDNYDLKKLLTFPYCVVEMSNFQGNALLLKPELLWENSFKYEFRSIALQPFSRLAVMPYCYNTTEPGAGVFTTAWSYKILGTDQTVSQSLPTGEGLDCALWLSDFPQFSLLNNSYISYMASTTHTRAYNYNAAGWRYNFGVTAADTAQHSQNLALQTQQANFDASVQGLAANMANEASKMVLGAQMPGGGGTVQSAITSGINSLPFSGVVDSALDMLSQHGWRVDNAVNNLTGYTAQKNTQSLGYAQSGLNHALAVSAAQLNEDLAFHAIGAAEQDAQLLPPSMVGQLGGEGFLWKNGFVGFCLTIKMATGATLQTTIQTFKRFGYRVNRFYNFKGAKMTALKLMSHFTYWTFLQTMITCAKASEDEVNTIRGIFERGTTVWGNPDDIGTTEMNENKVRNTIELR